MAKQNNSTYRHTFGVPPADKGPYPTPDDAESINLGEPSTWKRVQTPCSLGKHDPVVDPTENSIDGHVGYRCRNCGIGWIVKKNAVVNN